MQVLPISMRPEGTPSISTSKNTVLVIFSSAFTNATMATNNNPLNNIRLSLALLYFCTVVLFYYAQCPVGQAQGRAGRGKLTFFCFRKSRPSKKSFRPSLFLFTFFPPFRKEITNCKEFSTALSHKNYSRHYKSA